MQAVLLCPHDQGRGDNTPESGATAEPERAEAGQEGEAMDEERGGGGEDESEKVEDPFLTVPVEVVFHVLACLVRPTPTPSLGDDYGGPYEAAVESAVQLIRLQQVSKWWRALVQAEEQKLWARAWQNLCVSLPRGCYDSPPLSRVPLALQAARLALRGSPPPHEGSPIEIPDNSVERRTPKQEAIEHLQILKRRKTGDVLSMTICKSQVSGQCDTWSGLAVHVSPHGFLIYDLESGELQRELLIPWGRAKGKALCAAIRPVGKSVHIIGLAFTGTHAILSRDDLNLNSRALQLHVFDLETASPLHRAELTYHCGVTYFPDCSLSPSGRWLCAFSPGRALLLWDLQQLDKAIAAQPAQPNPAARLLRHAAEQLPDHVDYHHLYHQLDTDLDGDDISLLRSIVTIPATVEDHNADMFRFALTRDRYATAAFAGADQVAETQVKVMQLVDHGDPVQVGHAVVPRPRIEQLAVNSRMLGACVEDADVMLYRYADDDDETDDRVNKRPKFMPGDGGGPRSDKKIDVSGSREMVLLCERPLHIVASFYSPPQPRVFMDEWSMYYFADFRKPEDDVVLQFSIDAFLRCAHTAAQQPLHQQNRCSTTTTTSALSVGLSQVSVSRPERPVWQQHHSDIEADALPERIKRKRATIKINEHANAMDDDDDGARASKPKTKLSDSSDGNDDSNGGCREAALASVAGTAPAEDDWRRALIARLPLSDEASPDPAGGSNERTSMLLFGEDVVLHVGSACIITRNNNNDSRYRILRFQ